MIRNYKLNRYVLVVPLLLGGTNLAFGASEYYQGQEVVANEVLVKFKTSAAVANVQSVKAQEDVDVDEHVGSIGVRKLRSRTLDVSTLIRHLKGRADVEYVEPNIIYHTAVVPNDPSFGLTWGLRNTGQTVNGVVGTAGADIKAETAWNISVGSRANVVGVVDTGIDYNHPDLAANVWSAPSSFTVTIGGVTITCAAGTHGFNAINNTCNPMDDNASNYHGTHVSGTIGAVGNNGAGVAGVNQVASIMGLKFLGSNGSGSLANAINAIEFAIQAKSKFGASANVRVLSNSWGCAGCFSQALLDEINKANASDMLFIAAAGNSNNNNDTAAFYPSNYSAPNVIAVAATDNKDARASFSNYGATTVHLGAPGVDIYSTKFNNAYQYLSGTSMATPHVAGAAALLLSKCTLTTATLKSTLLGNVDSIASMQGVTTTGGRLNVNKALTACATVPLPDFVFTAISAPPASVDIGGSFTINNTVKNQGTIVSGASSVQLYLSTDTIISPTDFYVGFWNFVDKCGTNGCGIPAGASFSDATVMTVHPETPPGTYYVGGIVDNNNYVLESNENNNNIVYAGSKVTVVRNVDLIVTAVSTVASATRGTTINIPVSIKNQGTTVASTGNSYATVYLSKDATINNADWNLGRVIYGGYLAAGATASGTLTVTLPTAAIGLAAGTYYIGAFVDAELAQPETNETNNAKAGNTIIIN